MRMESPSPLASLPGWLRAYAGRGRRWLAARGASTRIGLFLILLAILGSAGYVASLDDPSERTWSWIFEGHKLSSEEVQAISDTLEVESIPHFADRSAGKVGVKPLRKAEAIAALGKHKISPRTLDDLSLEEPGNAWDPLEDRQRRELAARERSLKYMIEKLHPSITSAHVNILRTRTRNSLYAPWNVGASVYLEVEGKRQLDHRLVAGIDNFLKSLIPDLNPKDTHVIDQNGFDYLSPDNPEITKQWKTHALEEAWREKISEALQHIPGVGVDVLLETVEAKPSPPSPPSVVARDLVVTNGKMIIEPDPPVQAPSPPVEPTRTKANVWVRVPRSFYLLDFASKYPSRFPTQEDLDRMKETTERLIHDAVEIHIPKDELGVVKVDVIQDDLASPRQLLIPSASEPHRPWIWAALSGLVVLAAVGSVAAMVWRATHRQPSRPSRSLLRTGYIAEGPSGPLPGPSERVRELIRLNPEAAAGVLQRWIGQGGALP
jgi:flagellar biosynthesis/type III secretory pathway M-ring protein FliF/YscJ